MNSEWRTVEISSICEGIFDGPHATPKKTTQGPIFLGISSLNRGRLNLTNTEHLSEDDFKKWTKRVTPQEGDIVFSYETRLGEVAIIPADLRCCLGRRMALMRIDRKKAVPEYVLYAYMSPAFQNVLKSRTRHGSTVDRIPLTEFGNYPISIPDLKTQREIAKTLSTLDDRITLLRETNQTLESISQAIFKSWFVDFDPVRVKMEGRQPEGMDEGTSSLFPDSFEESEVGLIPKGWLVGEVKDLGEVICGKTPATSNSEYYGNEIPFVTIPDMHNNLLITTTNRSLSKKGADSQIKKYLRKGSICISCIATPGLVSQITSEAQTNQQINSVVPFAKWGDNFTLFTLRLIGEAVKSAGSGGSVFHNLSKSRFETLTTLLPDALCAQTFNLTVTPIIEKITINQYQIQSLSDIRDTLLPRLISGQLRLPEAQEQVEDALS